MKTKHVYTTISKTFTLILQIFKFYLSIDVNFSEDFNLRSQKPTALI